MEILLFITKVFVYLCILGHHRQLLQAGFFIKTKHQVHILNGLSGRTLNDIINRRANYQQPGALVQLQVDITEITASHPPGMRPNVRRQQAHKIFISIKFLPERAQFRLTDRPPQMYIYCL